MLIDGNDEMDNTELLSDETGNPEGSGPYYLLGL